MNNTISKLEDNLSTLLSGIGEKNGLIVKKIVIGESHPVAAALLYMNGIVNKQMIDRDVLKPLMLEIKEDLSNKANLCEYLNERYILISDTKVEQDTLQVISSLKRGKSILIIDGVLDYIIIETAGEINRGISEPSNESSLRGTKEGFIEDLHTNLGIIRKHIKDKNLTMETFTVGTRTETDLVMLYISDIADQDIILEIKNRVNAINIDSVQGIGVVEQLIEKYPFTIFPQVVTTERPDRVIANLLEGRIAILLDGTPFVGILPAIISDFFQAVEDYYERTLLSSFVRILRMLAVLIVITLPSIYLIFIRFNAELVPIKLLIPIIQSRKGIPFPPLLEILSMEFVIEFLREGGLRLPSKIGQTLSVVGGFIIGSAAISAKIVSPATIIVIGISALGTFVIPNYEMALAIRLIRFPILIISNLLGGLGLIASMYVILVHLFSLDSFGVPYCFTNKYGDLKDIFIRFPLWKMNKRPESIPNNNPIRQTDFRKNFKKNKN